MKKVILITGAATGIGNLTAKALAADGHTVYASMRDPAGRDAAHAQKLLDIAKRHAGDLRVVQLRCAVSGFRKRGGQDDP